VLDTDTSASAGLSPTFSKEGVRSDR